jgi:hypothetical protein
LTVSRETRGLVEIALRAGMNDEKRLSTRDCVANIAQDIHSGGLVERRSGAARNLCYRPAVDLADCARAVRVKGVYQAPRHYRWRPSALCIDDPIERLARGTRAQQLLCAMSPGFNGPDRRIPSQNAAGKKQCFLDQIGWSLGIIVEGPNHVAGFQRRANASADWFAAVGGESLHR